MLLRIGILLAFVSVSLGQANSNDVRQQAHARNKAAVRAAYTARLKQCGQDPDILVRPGIIANRRLKQVRVQAEATGLSSGVAEFFLVGQNSSHDYEALALSFAKPGEIQKALMFIGMEPGRPVDHTTLQFWPKGERVLMTFAAAVPDPVPIRVDQLVIDTRTGKPLPQSGLVFTGSREVENEDNPGQVLYFADVRDPMSVAATYNEPESVLDVPRIAPQGEVYESYLVNTQHVFAAGELLDVVIEPMHGGGTKRVVTLLLEANMRRESATGRPVDSAVFDLFEGDKALGENVPLPAVLKIFTSLSERGRDPFVTTRFGADLLLGVLKQLCAVLAAIDTETGIRIEAPVQGQLYYKAFLPNESFRDREERVFQPWELRLTTAESGVSGVLTQIEQVWREGEIRPDLRINHIEVPTPGALRKELHARGPGLPVILVYAQSQLTHGQLMAFLAPVQGTHGTIHVFVD